MEINMKEPFSLGDNVVIAIETREGPDFVAYILLAQLKNKEWYCKVTDEDRHRVTDEIEYIIINEENIQDFTEEMSASPPSTLSKRIIDTTFDD